MEVDTLKTISTHTNNNNTSFKEKNTQRTKQLENTNNVDKNNSTFKANEGKSAVEDKAYQPVSSPAENEKEIKSVIDSANKMLKVSGRQLQYSIHEKTNKVMVKVIDSDTHEVIREIPPQNVLDSYAKMLELAGILVDERG